jgi:hypothetical protein
MSKPAKKKPAAPAMDKSVMAALHPTATKPGDAGKPGAMTGGKGGSGKKGR